MMRIWSRRVVLNKRRLYCDAAIQGGVDTGFGSTLQRRVPSPMSVPAAKA
jgi:hypothetical protein